VNAGMSKIVLSKVTLNQHLLMDKKMIKKHILALLVAGSLSVSGCSTVVNMRAGATKFDLTTVQETVEENAVKSPIFKQVKSITVADFSDYMDEFPNDNRRLYRSLVKELSTMLEETGEFKVISSSAFKDTLDELDLDIDLTNSDEEEMEEQIAKVGKAMGTHGVVYIDLDTIGNETSFGNQMKYMGQLITDGSIQIDMEARMNMVRSLKSEVLWSQMSKVQWISGSNGLETTKSRELKEIVRKTLTPLVNQIVSDHKA
jgi:curli biogenesis system outer membrane secretion channel CsgG